MCDAYVFMLCYCYDMFYVCAIKVTALIRATLNWCKILNQNCEESFNEEF